MSKIKGKSSRTIRSSGRSAKASVSHIRGLRTAQEGADTISGVAAGAHHEPAGDPIPGHHRLLVEPLRNLCFGPVTLLAPL
jgi:hypothetical protein